MVIYGIGEGRREQCGMGDALELKTLKAECIWTGGHYPLFKDKLKAQNLLDMLTNTWANSRLFIMELEYIDE